MVIAPMKPTPLVFCLFFICRAFCANAMVVSSDQQFGRGKLSGIALTQACAEFSPQEICNFFQKQPMLYHEILSLPERYEDLLCRLNRAVDRSWSFLGRIETNQVAGQAPITWFPARAQLYLECGLHAVHNALCFFLAHDQDEALQLLGNDLDFSISNFVCICLLGSTNFSVKECGVMVDKLLMKLASLHKISACDVQNITVIRGESAELIKYMTGEAEVNEDFFWKCDELALKNTFATKRDYLFHGKAQVFIVCSHDHWLAIRVGLAPGFVDKFTVWGVDSLIRSHPDNIHAVQRILKLLNIQIV